MRYTAIAVAAITLAALEPAIPAGATTYHVAWPAGSDANPGTAELPWETLQHAVDAPVVVPGDTIMVHGSSYRGARITRSGSPGLPIILTAAPSNWVVLGPPLTPFPHDTVLELDSASWWVIQGFHIYAVDAQGVRSSSGIDLRNGSHVTVRQNQVWYSRDNGIYAASSPDLLIEDNEISFGCRRGIHVTGGADGVTVDGNWVRENQTVGIDLHADSALPGDGIITGVVVGENRFERHGFDSPYCANAAGGPALRLDGTLGALVRNNLIWEVHGGAGILALRGNGAICASGSRILNNTVLTAADGGWAYFQDDSSAPSGCPSNLVINNLLWSDNPAAGAISLDVPSPSGFASRHNVTQGVFSTDGGASTLNFGQWQALGYGSGSREIADAAALADLFVDYAGDDFHLTAGSDAVDAGELRADVPTDLDERPRPFGPTHDAGCYEFGAPPDIFADGFESGDTSGWSETVPP